MKPPLNVYQPASGLVTVTFREPSAAPPETETITVSFVELFHVTEPTETPEPENDTVAPFTNPVPVKMMVWFD